jgi:hypothetical protein
MAHFEELIGEEQFDEEDIIQYYFFRGYNYEEIRRFLQKNHAIEMGIRTLKRRVKSYGLRRRQAEYEIAREKLLKILLMVMIVFKGTEQCGILYS